MDTARNLQIAPPASSTTYFNPTLDALLLEHASLYPVQLKEKIILSGIAVCLIAPWIYSAIAQPSFLLHFFSSYRFYLIGLTLLWGLLNYFAPSMIQLMMNKDDHFKEPFTPLQSPHLFEGVDIVVLEKIGLNAFTMPVPSKKIFIGHALASLCGTKNLNELLEHPLARAIILHEIGHHRERGRHIFLTFLRFLLPLSLFFAMAYAKNFFGFFSSFGTLNLIAIALCLNTVFTLAFQKLSRQEEWRADHFADFCLRRQAMDPATLPDALNLLRSHIVHPGLTLSSSHPSINQRIALKKIFDHPDQNEPISQNPDFEPPSRYPLKIFSLTLACVLITRLYMSAPIYLFGIFALPALIDIFSVLKNQPSLLRFAKHPQMDVTLDQDPYLKNHVVLIEESTSFKNTDETSSLLFGSPALCIQETVVLPEGRSSHLTMLSASWLQLRYFVEKFYPNHLESFDTRLSERSGRYRIAQPHLRDLPEEAFDLLKRYAFVHQRAQDAQKFSQTLGALALNASLFYLFHAFYTAGLNHFWGALTAHLGSLAIALGSIFWLVHVSHQASDDIELWLRQEAKDRGFDLEPEVKKPSV